MVYCIAPHSKYLSTFGVILIARQPATSHCHSRSTKKVRSQPENGDVINEELIKRLQAAEAEAQRLKAELGKVTAANPPQTSTTKQGGGSGQESDSNSDPLSSSRIDGGDLLRETMSFVPSKRRNWLSESDVDFFTGAGPGERGDGELSADDKSTVQKRLLIGILLSALAGGFALIPTTSLAPPPSKPLFFYLSPLLQAQQYLIQLETVIPEGDYGQLTAIISRIEGNPCKIQSNLRDAAASLGGATTVQEAEFVARDVYELVKQIDYQQYYDSIGRGGGSGGRNEKEFYDFSLKAARAASAKLKEFLKYMPADQLEAAQQIVNSSNSVRGVGNE